MSSFGYSDYRQQADALDRAILDRQSPPGLIRQLVRRLSRRARRDETASAKLADLREKRGLLECAYTEALLTKIAVEREQIGRIGIPVQCDMSGQRQLMAFARQKPDARQIAADCGNAAFFTDQGNSEAGGAP
jgi:1,6-anhydro-N-acetylmuramate kinase